MEPKGKKQFLKQAVFASAFAYLTSGVYLSGLAIYMGAGDVLVSYLSVIINICGVLILVFSTWLQRIQSRKRLAVVLTLLSRVMTVFLIAIPVLVPKDTRMPLFLLVVIIAFTLQAQTTVVLNQWMLGFVEEDRRGRYVSKRQTMMLVVQVVLSLLGGWWMDYMQGQYLGFLVLFLLAAVFSLADLLLLLRIPDIPVPVSEGCRTTLWELIQLPLKNRAFTGFVFYIFMFYLLLTIGDSFTMVYLMKYLALPYQTVTAMYLIISLPQVFLLGIWGRISDKYGHKFALQTSIWLFAGETLFLLLASPNSWYLCIPLAFLIASVANAGFTVAVFNRRYELMPDENRMVYDNFYTAVIGVGFILGPIIGGACKGILENLPEVPAMPFGNIRLLYFLSTIGIIVLQLCTRRADLVQNIEWKAGKIKGDKWSAR